MTRLTKLISVLLLVLWLAAPAQATLPPVTNFAKGTVSTGYTSAATSIVLQAGHGARFPITFPYPLVWWNVTDYASPEDDPNVEIISVTGRSTDTLTVVRGEEGTSAVNHNTAGKTYLMVLTLTKGMWDQIQADLTAAAGAVSSSSQFRTGTGSPEGAVLGNSGDVYQRTDGSTNFDTLYAKISGDNTTAGWIALQVQPNWATPGAIGATTPAAVTATTLTATTLTATRFNSKSWSPTYGATVTIDVSLGTVATISATNSTAFIISNPINSTADDELWLRVKNSSGAALGTITWDTQYIMANFTKPAAGKYRVVHFKRIGTVWVELNCSPEITNEP